MHSLEALLTELGLNNTESKIYTTLIYRGNSKASELAKITNIHRVQVYTTLESLSKKNFISKIEFQGAPTLFKPIPLNEVLNRIKIKQEQDYKILSERILKEYRGIERELKSKEEQPEVLLYSGWIRALPLLQKELLSARETIIMVIEPELVKKISMETLNTVFETKNVYYPTFGKMVRVKNLDQYLGLTVKWFSKSFEERYQPLLKGHSVDSSFLNFIIIDNNTAIL
ncbi:MAG: TrmB family transcriptional regulator, partial [Candidatus Hodarchaeales archaeon]